MPRSYVTLAEHPSDIVRLACTKCERRGRAVSHGDADRALRADANMVDLRLKLAASCPKIAANQIMDLCGVYPDRLPK